MISAQRVLEHLSAFNNEPITRAKRYTFLDDASASSIHTFERKLMRKTLIVMT